LRSLGIFRLSEPPRQVLTNVKAIASDDRTLRLALVTLAELVEQVKDGPAPPTTAIRLALAVCHQHGNGDIAPFTDFWRAMQDPHRSQTETIARYCRSSHLMTQLRGVLRAVGLDPCVAVEQPLLDAARKARAARLAFDQAHGRAA
jgi:hypothetical protein